MKRARPNRSARPLAGALLAAAAALTPGPTPAASAGPVRVTLRNGTTGGAGRADLVTLYRLGAGMEPVASVENPVGEAVLDAPEETAPGAAGGMRPPYLAQATYAGVNYNQPVRLNADGSAALTLTVYDGFDRWEEQEISLTTWRALYRRLPAGGDRPDALRADHIFVIENRSDPPRTFVSGTETLRFRLPPESALLGVPSVSATGATGMPVPQSPFPVAAAGADGNDYAVRTAFKPGETEIVLSYEVRYAEQRHEASLVAPRDSPEVMLLAQPPDILLALPADATGVSAAGWEILGPDEEAGLTVARKRGVAAGEPVRMVFSGGSRPPAAGTGGGTGGGAGGAGPFSAPPASRPENPALPPVEAPASGSGGDPEVGAVGLLPDPTRAGKWAIALLMAAALGFGLLHRVFGSGGAGSGGGTG